MDFDSGILNGITFGDDFDFNMPIVAFIESWMNMDPIGDLRIKRGMKKTEFLKYFEAWEGRAKKLQNVSSNRLLRAQTLTVSFEKPLLPSEARKTFSLNVQMVEAAGVEGSQLSLRAKQRGFLGESASTISPQEQPACTTTKDYRGGGGSSLLPRRAEVTD